MPEPSDTHSITRRDMIAGSAAMLATTAIPAATRGRVGADAPQKRIGVIGLDTSHAPAFAKMFNEAKPDSPLSAFRVTAAYPHGSATIESSVSRIPVYTKQFNEMKIDIVDSIDDLLGRVDLVLLETNDGQLHLQQAVKVMDAGKPVFIDKPIAASLTDTLAIFEHARRKNVLMYSASSLRYAAGVDQVRSGEHGKVNGVMTYSPMSIEPTHPDLYWYGIHGVEMLYAALGTGCQTVQRTAAAHNDVSVGLWSDGRVGTFRGIRNGKKSYGGQAFTDNTIAPLGPYKGYAPLVEAIAQMWLSGKAPVTPEETIEIYAFMSAADESKKRGGQPVKISDVLDAAKQQVDARLKEVMVGQ